MGILNEANHWSDQGSCKTHIHTGGTDYWYQPEPGDADYGDQPAGFFPVSRSHPARKICGECPVRVQCLSYAMAMEVEGEDGGEALRWGIWGGLLPDDRRKLNRRLEGLTPGEQAQVIREIATAPVYIPRDRRPREVRERDKAA